eukprot:TRINITY_DN3717_c4_g1_i1.p1 TRINITY_DN3717_c4_g1~~TRINITY_DN3717_c4_g1_i1.p1  ORF type:complete len:418 (+),score=37.78 TRINITY_DN3717_c4_g1_i1:125-1255(+)
MDVNVIHTESGLSCVVDVAESYTVLDVKVAALAQLFGDVPGIALRAGRLSARTGDGDDLDDSHRMSDTLLEGGDEMHLVSYWVEVEAPAEYDAGDTFQVRSIALSPCGRLCVVGFVAFTGYGPVRVFDTTTAARLATLSASVHIAHASFSRCSKWLASSLGHRVEVWNTATWRLLHVHSQSGVTSTGWAPDGHLVSGSREKKLCVWRVDQDECVNVVTAHTSASHEAIAVSHTHIYSAAHDGFIRVWDLSGLHTATLEEHTGGVLDLALTSDNAQLVSCSADRTVKVWCTEMLNCLYTLRLSGVPTRVAVSEVGKVAVWFRNGVDLWCPSTGECIRAGDQLRGIWLALSPCGRYLFTSRERHVHVSYVGGMCRHVP